MARDKQHYVVQSYNKAFGQYNPSDWDHHRGFAYNQPRILKLYDYYRDTYLAKPDRFLWAGLGRMAGGAVVGGLRVFVTAGETIFSQTMVKIGREIFEDLAWQHEAVLDDEANALTLAAAHDNVQRARHSYHAAWSHILSNDPTRIAKGNKMLLEIEQFTIIQPYYDALGRTSEAGLLGPMRSMSAFTNSIHPYHRDFRFFSKTGDIAVFADRWAWITETGGMWEKWGETRGTLAQPIAMSQAERTRLVSLTMDKILRREFAPIDESLRPPGAFDI
ncbi:MAG TPA: hypothetical protein VFK57_18965 [Vicinamibacterales bacterium]|nr:hypothetical protein [Vicinamibacterales bacterium]